VGEFGCVHVGYSSINIQDKRWGVQAEMKKNSEE
jgi:hypothetical protein